MDGGCSSPLHKSQRVADGISDQLSSLSLEGDEEHRNMKELEKDPRTIARKYQIDLCMKAMEENVIVYLGTGCGKTHIAVLLIYEMGHLIKKPQKSECIFLAPTVALVQQMYIRDQSFEPSQFFTFGHPCPVTWKKVTEKNIHFRCSDKINGANAEVRCNKGHHWLHKKVIADVVEALIIAFIVDSGFKAATAFLNWIGIQVYFSPSQIHNICSASATFLPLADQIDVNALENLLRYKFYQKGLLIQAFVHPSFNNHLGGCYQFNPLRDLRELCQYHKYDVQFSSVKKDDKLSVEAKVDAKKVKATACATNVSGKLAKKIAARQVFECLKAQGYRTKSKSLEEVLRKCEKREARLIGYDETSSLESVKSGKLKIQESPRSDCDVKLYPLSEASTSKHDIVSRPLRQPSYRHTASVSHVTQTIHNNGCNVESPASHLNNESGLDPQGTGSICIGTAKSRLYEMCAANCWKPPIFECCDETGPSHFKQFIYKIVLDIEEMPEETFEFYGEPRTRKKDAAENAAQGAIWFLKCQGYL